MKVTQGARTIGITVRWRFLRVWLWWRCFHFGEAKKYVG